MPGAKGEQETVTSHPALDLSIFEEYKRCVVASGVIFGNLIGNPV
jgi:hypothetical protein